jgi:lipoprotein NlpI
MQKIAVLLVLLLLPCASVANPVRHDSGGYAFYVDAVPAWTTSQAVPAMTANTTDAASGATRLRLMDLQTLVAAEGTTQFRRVVWRVRNQAGVDSLSNLDMNFIPEYQKLVIHDVAVIRNGKRESRLDPASVRLVPNEAELDKRIYRGSVAASIFVRDIKVGDDVEFSASIEGMNPVFENRLSLFYALAGSVPADAIRVRLRSTAGKAYFTRVLNSTAQPVEKSGSGFAETSIALDDVAPFVPEEDSSRRNVFPMVQFGEFRDWEEVASWAGRLFDAPNVLPAGLGARVEAWRAQAGSSREAARLALDYVQREIAYVSVSIGENSHRPAPPETVFARGFGDCKDKALLLSVLLKALGMNAHPALVSSEFGGATDEMLPGTYAFDHVITILDLDGETYWLDGTNRFQAGPLVQRFAGSYGFALAIGRSAPSFVAVSPPSGYRVGYKAIHRFRVDDYSRPVQLVVEGTYSGSAAESTRAYIQSSGQEQFEKWFDDSMRQVFPTMERHSGIDVRDDESDNRIFFRSEVQIADFFSRNNGRLEAKVAPTALLRRLYTVEHKGRKSPMKLAYPEAIDQTIIVEFPDDIRVSTTEPVALQNEYRAFRMEQHYRDRRLTAVFHYETRRDEIPQSQIASDAEFIKRIRRRSVVGLAIPIAASQSVIAKLEGKAESGVAASIENENASQLRAVTAEIESGRLSRRQMVRAYVERAWKLERLERYAEAVQDAERALDLDPDDGEALETKAADLSSLRKFDEALEAYRVAEKRTPDSKELLYGRGRLYYYWGKYAEAEQDLRRALGVAGSHEYSYYLAWLYMASVRAGKEGSREIEPFLSDGSRSEWPGPVVDMFLGSLAPEELLAIAQRTDERTAVLQQCEAQFFIGQYHLLKGQNDQAELAFRKSRATGIRQYMEYQYSGWELDALAGRTP